MVQFEYRHCSEGLKPIRFSMPDPVRLEHWSSSQVLSKLTSRFCRTVALAHTLWTKFSLSRSAQRARSVMSTITGLFHSEYRQTLESKSDVSLTEHTDFNHWFWESTLRRANKVMLQHTLTRNATVSNFQHNPITDGCTGKMAQDEYLHKSDILGTVGRTVGGGVVSEVVV